MASAAPGISRRGCAKESNRQVLRASVHVNDEVIENVLDLGSDVIVTKNIPEKE